MPKPYYLRELPNATLETHSTDVYATSKRYNVYDMSRSGHGHRIGSFETAEKARRFAEKITASHSQMWGFAAGHRWNFSLLKSYQDWWRVSGKLRLNLR